METQDTEPVMEKDPLEMPKMSAESSEEEESLATLKRRQNKKRSSVKKRSRKHSDSEERTLLPEVLIKVEIEEFSGEETALDYSNPRSNTPSNNLIDPEIHKKWKPPSRRKTYRCTTCNIVFPDRAELRTHAITHQVQTRHKCDICGKCFAKAFGLRTHKRMHTNPDYKCPCCDASFKMQLTLGRHMTYHEKTEKCDQCPATFHTKEQLDEHVCGEQPRRRRHHRRIIRPPVVEDAPTQENSSPKNSEESDYSETPEENPENPSLKREDLNYQTQCAIVNKMLKGRSITDICDIYNLKAEVVNEIWEDRDEFTVVKKTGRKSIKYMNSIIDGRILEWFNNQKASGVQVTGKMLMDYAETLAKEYGFIAFNGSKKWLERFKQKYKIVFRSAPFKRNYQIPPDSKWKKDFLANQWLDVRNGVSDHDIYTADEVGVFYNPSKSRIKKMGGKKYIHGAPKDRLSIFLCTNMTGTDKKRLLVCGSEDPLLRSYRNPETLPVTYLRHPEAHFTTAMFEEYVRYWNRELQLQDRKAILILDRATIHSKLTLSNLKLVFVPWKASAALIPMKNGIFNEFRSHYRSLILQDKCISCVRGVDRNLTCLEALNLVEKAWQRTSKQAIVKSFLNIGYDLRSEMPQFENEEPVYNSDEYLCKFLQDYSVDNYYCDLTSLENYLTVDEEFLTGHGTNGSVFGGNHKTQTAKKPLNDEILPLATNKPATEENENIVLKSRALDDLEIVRRYLQTNNTPHSMYKKFMDVEQFLMNRPLV